MPLVESECGRLLREAEARVKELEAERDALLAEVVAWTDGAPRTADTLKALMAERDALRAEVERLRMEFRRIEEVVASMVAGERCYAQVLKVLHEAPRVLPAPKEGA